MASKKVCVRFLCNVQKRGIIVKNNVQDELCITLFIEPVPERSTLKYAIQKEWAQKSITETTGTPNHPTTIEVLNIISMSPAVS